MRPVARIAQSVEQGIENPRVLGSIPSPGTTIQRTQPMAGFLHFCSRTLHRTTFDYSPPAAHPCGAGAAGAPFNASGVSPSRAPLFKEPAQKAAFCISAAGRGCFRIFLVRRTIHLCYSYIPVTEDCFNVSGLPSAVERHQRNAECVTAGSPSTGN